MLTAKTAQNILLLTITIMIVAFIMRVLPSTRTIDDAFITFRYSRNLVDGQGFVYNPNVQTLGTTTPLFTLLMAAISLIGGQEGYPWYALTVSALADAITCALIYAIARRVIPNILIAALPALLWAISPMSVTFAIGGMETSVNILWMVAATWFYTSGDKRPRTEIAIGVLAGLGILTRIDSALWVLALFGWQFLDYLITRRDVSLLRRLPWRTWAAFAVILLPWSLFAWGYFGSPVPNSLTAKTNVYIMPPMSAMVQFIRTYSNLFFEFDTFGAIGVTVASIVYLLLAVVALIFTARRLPRLMPFLLYTWGYFAAFSIANPLIFRWYLAPPLLPLMLAVVIGAWAIFSSIGSIKRGAKEQDESTNPPRGAIVIVGLMGALWVFTSLNGWTLSPDHGADRPAPSMAWHEVELHYQDMATMLRDEYGVTRETRIAAGDIGAVGWFSDATIIDTVGLISPEMRQYYPFDPSIMVEGQNYAVPPQLIYDADPEYILLMEAAVRNGLGRDARFAELYELIREIPTGYYGTGMQLYQRRG